MPHPAPAGNVVDYANPFTAQPPFSRIVLEPHEDGVSYTFLPDGLARSAVGLVGLGVMVAAWCVAFVVAMWIGVREDPVGAAAGAVMNLLLLAPLILLWVAMYRGAVRPTVLSCRAGRLMLFSSAALFRPVKSWDASDVQAIEVNVRGVTGKMRVSGDLNLRLRSRGRAALLIAGRETIDLEWVARGLRATQGLGAER